MVKLHNTHYDFISTDINTQTNHGQTHSPDSDWATYSMSITNLDVPPPDPLQLPKYKLIPVKTWAQKNTMWSARRCLLKWRVLLDRVWHGGCSVTVTRALSQSCRIMATAKTKLALVMQALDLAPYPPCHATVSLTLFVQCNLPTQHTLIRAYRTIKTHISHVNNLPGCSHVRARVHLWIPFTWI